MIENQLIKFDADHSRKTQIKIITNQRLMTEGRICVQF